MRHVADEQNVAGLCRQFLSQPLRRIVGPEAAHHPEIRERIDTQKCLSRLPRPQLATVPDGRWHKAQTKRVRGEPGRLLLAFTGERPLRIHRRPDRIRMMNQARAHRR